MIRRSGTTLVEVLVAIFITALGLLGLLALFPLGAVNMAQALKDSRCAQAAASAFARAEAANLRNDPLLVGQGTDVFVDDDHGTRPRLDQVPGYDGPSYPVYIDPLGVLGGMGNHCGSGAAGIPRQSVSFLVPPPPVDAHHPVSPATSVAMAHQWFSLLDDVNFVKDGPYTGWACTPQTLPHGGTGPGVLQREGRYSWAYLLRRPRWSDRSVVDLTVVVYSGRPTVPGKSESVYTSIVFPADNTPVRVHWGGAHQNPEKPALRAGSWILDATLVSPVRGTVSAPDPHGFFYRVVNVTEGSDAGGSYVDLELQSPPKKPTPNGQGVLVVLEGVAEVFEKGPGWRP